MTLGHSKVPPRFPLPAGRRTKNNRFWTILSRSAVVLALPATGLASEGIGFPFKKREPTEAEIEAREKEQLRHPEKPLRNQRVHRGSPPISPNQRAIEGGRLPILPREASEADWVYSRRRYVNTNSPAQAPGKFNPDPGGSTSRGQTR